ncbi:MAG: hypothetical protein AAF907_13475, partial [Planctomycetota bacterium]
MRAAVVPRAEALLAIDFEGFSEVNFEGCGGLADDGATWGEDAWGFAAAVGRRFENGDRETKSRAIRLLSQFGTAAKSEAYRLIPLIDAWPVPYELVPGKFPRYEGPPILPNEAVPALARIAPAEPKLLALLIDRLPGPKPADLSLSPPEEPPVRDWDAPLSKEEREVYEAWVRRQARWERRWRERDRRVEEIARVLRLMGPHAGPAVPRLLSFLQDNPSYWAWEEVYWAIGAAGPLPEEALIPFAKFAGNPHLKATWVGPGSPVGDAAHHGLRITGPRAIPPLIDALDSVDPKPTRADAVALINKENRFVESLEETSDDTLIDETLERLTDDRISGIALRLELFKKFGPLPPPEATAVLRAVTPFLDHEANRLKERAFGAVAANRPPAAVAVPVLLKRLRHENAEVRRLAVTTLKTYHTADGVATAVLLRLADDDLEVRKTTLSALTTFRHEAGVKEALAIALKDP